MNTGKVAVVACGGLREFSKCYHTWNLFEQQHSYVLTWDVDYMTAKYKDSPVATVTKIEELVKAKETGYIQDYEVFVEPTQFEKQPRFKNLFLWSQIEQYISYDYDYVLITRPDTVFRKNINSEFRLPEENEVYVTWINEDNKSVSDGEFFMTRATLKKFSEIYQYSVDMQNIVDEETKRHFYCIVGPHTHLIIYKFLKESNINIIKMINNYTDAILYRTALKITDLPTDKDLRNEMFREFSIQDKHNSNMEVPDAVLIVSDKFLSGNQRNILMNKFLDENKLKLLNKYMIFESYTASAGIDKIRNFEKNYNIRFSDIITLHL